MDLLLFLLSLIAGILALATSTAIETSNITSSNLFRLPEFQCVALDSWTANQFPQWACRSAFTYAQTVEAWHANNRFEFLPDDEHSVTRAPRMDTPRRYSISQSRCSDIDLPTVPFGPRLTWPARRWLYSCHRNAQFLQC